MMPCRNVSFHFQYIDQPDLFFGLASQMYPQVAFVCRCYRMFTHGRMPVEPVDFSFASYAHLCKQVTEETIPAQCGHATQYRDQFGLKYCCPAVDRLPDTPGLG